MSIKYSICICNYNMAKTIEQALISILDQIDHDYEVLVIDDGSSDDSLDVLKKLSSTYQSLRYIALDRDKHRLLGGTRNVSIQEARGAYVLPQFDCDDVYQVCIKDFVEVFHQLEKSIGNDFYLKGDKLNMGRRDFMLKHGPYRNMFKEDRDMWIRLASDDALIPLVHNRIFIRLPKTRKESTKRALYKIWAHLQADYRANTEYLAPFRNLLMNRSKSSFRVRLLRCLYSPFAFITAKFMEPLPMPDQVSNLKLKDYWLEKQGTFRELMQRYNSEPDLGKLSEDGRLIFDSIEINEQN